MRLFWRQKSPKSPLSHLLDLQGTQSQMKFQSRLVISTSRVGPDSPFALLSPVLGLEIPFEKGFMENPFHIWFLWPCFVPKIALFRKIFWSFCPVLETPNVQPHPDISLLSSFLVDTILWENWGSPSGRLRRTHPFTVKNVLNFSCGPLGLFHLKSYGWGCLT